MLRAPPQEKKSGDSLTFEVGMGNILDVLDILQLVLRGM